MFSEMQLLVICNALKGPATKIITAFVFTGKPLDMRGLIKWTRLERHTIDTGLRQLADYGLVVKQVMAHNRLVWMLATNMFPGTRKIEELGNGDGNFQFEGFPQTGPSSSSSSIVGTELVREEEQEEEPQNEGFPQTGQKDRTSPGYAACLNACDEFNIREPKRSRLSRMEHVTPDMIRAHCNQAKADGHDIGTAIHRIEFNWPYDEKYLLSDTQWGERSKYTRGPYGDFVEH